MPQPSRQWEEHLEIGKEEQSHQLRSASDWMVLFVQEQIDAISQIPLAENAHKEESSYDRSIPVIVR